MTNGKLCSGPFNISVANEAKPLSLTFDISTMKSFVTELFEKSGFSESQSNTTADVLIWADARGNGSHGILRIPTYMRWAETGIINRSAIAERISKKGAVITIAADRVIGPSALADAARQSIELVHEHSAVWVFVRGHSHAGSIGYYARQISEAGFLSVVMTSSRPLMAYHGTRNTAVSTNPIAVAIPGSFLLDMSPAAISKGKIDIARANDKSLPDGVVCDAEGKITTDPNQAKTILPLGGPKGAGLSLGIECLTSLTVANPLIQSALNKESLRSDFQQNSVLMAIEPDAILPGQDLPTAIDELSSSLKSQPRADGFEEILMPGERGDKEAARRQVEGITVSENTWQKIIEIARNLNVDVPVNRGNK